MALQSLLTINIITEEINFDLLEETVKIIDLIWRVNKLKPLEEQMHAKEFHNDAINNSVDLKPQMVQWSKQTKGQVQAKQPIERGTGSFMLCSYHWILNTHNKAVMLQMYNKLDWQHHRDVFLLRAFWDNKINPENYELEIQREDILSQSLKKIVQVNKIDGKEPLKLPLKIQFANEPGIDVGGVRKEYFSLIMRELFNPAFAMFKYNEDVQLYWFNGSTFEANINFELVGTLMGIAFYNNMFVDMPVVPACYKILLDVAIDLNDMAQWQPETAKSL